MAEDNIAVWGKDIVAESVIVRADFYAPVLQVDAKLSGVVELHIFPFGQTHNGIGVGHDFVDDDVVFRGFVNRKSGGGWLHHIVPQVFNSTDGQGIINAVANFTFQLQHHRCRIHAKNNRSRATQTIIN